MINKSILKVLNVQMNDICAVLVKNNYILKIGVDKIYIFFNTLDTNI